MVEWRGSGKPEARPSSPSSGGLGRGGPVREGEEGSRMAWREDAETWVGLKVFWVIEKLVTFMSQCNSYRALIDWKVAEFDPALSSSFFPCESSILFLGLRGSNFGSVAKVA